MSMTLIFRPEGFHVDLLHKHLHSDDEPSHKWTGNNLIKPNQMFLWREDFIVATIQVPNEVLMDGYVPVIFLQDYIKFTIGTVETMVVMAIPTDDLTGPLHWGPKK